MLPQGKFPDPHHGSTATLPLVFVLNILFVTATFTYGSRLPGEGRGGLCWKILVPVSRVSTPTCPTAVRAQYDSLCSKIGVRSQL